MRVLLVRLVVPSIVLVAACSSDDGSAVPDAATSQVDARVPEPDARPDAPPHPLAGYGGACTTGSDCASGLCIGSMPSTCSRFCSLDVALDCKDVDAFCVPLTGGGNGCYGTIETGDDTDDAVMQIGDSVTRAVTPLGDADVFLVHLDTLGTTTFTVTPAASIDVQLEAYGTLGSAIGVATPAGPGLPEALQTDVQQIGHHLFIVVRDVGTSTGNYTLAVAHVAAATSP
jgi:hypothetical protein